MQDSTSKPRVSGVAQGNAHNYFDVRVATQPHETTNCTQTIADAMRRKRVGNTRRESLKLSTDPSHPFYCLPQEDGVHQQWFLQESLASLISTKRVSSYNTTMRMMQDCLFHDWLSTLNLYDTRQLVLVPVISLTNATASVGVVASCSGNLYN